MLENSVQYLHISLPPNSAFCFAFNHYFSAKPQQFQCFDVMHPILTSCVSVAVLVPVFITIHIYLNSIYSTPLCFSTRCTRMSPAPWLHFLPPNGLPADNILFRQSQRPCHSCSEMCKPTRLRWYLLAHRILSQCRLWASITHRHQPAPKEHDQHWPGLQVLQCTIYLALRWVVHDHSR